MSKQIILMSAAIVLAALLAEPAAAAQGPAFGGRRNTSTVSPYLNLLRGGGIGSNYYQRVRPERDFRRANQDLNRSVDALRKRIQEQDRRGEQVKSGLSQTGHVPRFMNYGAFFPGLNRR